MLRSMTGYGTGSYQSEDTTVAVEVRTVNHRFLDVHIRIPREYSFLEPDIHQLVKSLLSRGRVDISINIQGTRQGEFEVDACVVRSYVEAAKKLKEDFQLEESLDLRTLLRLPGVLKGRDGTEKDADDPTGPLVLQSLRRAVEGAVKMRAREGEALQADLLRHLESIRDNANRLRELAPLAVVEFNQRFEERLAQLLPQNPLDASRVAQEVALLIEKSDISEELSRLESHLEQFARWMDSGQEVGKRMDFLLQEMQREVNTMLSKTGNLEITRSGIAVKADIEKLREQVQNVE